MPRNIETIASAGIGAVIYKYYVLIRAWLSWAFSARVTTTMGGKICFGVILVTHTQEI